MPRTDEEIRMKSPASKLLTVALLAIALIPIPVAAQQARLEGVDVSPKQVTAGSKVVVTITLDRPGAQPTLRTLGDPQALHIPPQPIAMYDKVTWSKQYTTGHFTDQSRQVQIRADWGGRARTVTLRVMPASAPAPPPPAAPTSFSDYVFDTPSEVSQLVAYARQKRFRFTATVRRGDRGACDLDFAPRVRMTPLPPIGPLTELPPRCQVTFFEARRLAQYWSLKEVEFSGGPGDYGGGHGIRFRWIKAPHVQHGDGDASFAILTEDALPNDYIDLSKVVLRGPSGRSWRQAFDGARR